MVLENRIQLFHVHHLLNFNLNQRIMKKTNVNKVLGVVMILLILASCSKKRLENDIASAEQTATETEQEQTQEEEKTPAFESGDLSALYSEFAPETQVFLIDSGDSGIIRGQQGTEVYCAKNQFTNVNGDTIDFPYAIHLIEVYKPWEMIFGKIPTVSGSDYLQCEGEVKLLAKKNDETLNLKSGEVYLLKIPSDSMIQNMELFYTDENGENTNWLSKNPYQETWDGITINVDGIVEVDSGYIMGSTQMGWSACSKNATGSSAASINFKSDSIPFNAMDLYIVNRQLNSVITVSDSVSLPIGANETVQIVAFAIDSKGNFFHVNESVQTPLDGNMTLKFKSVTKDNMIQAIKAL